MKLFLVGGFLGSGKTTAILKSCQLLGKDEAAVITNDQGRLLVDSAFIKSLNIPNKEVLNSCFCCDYEQLNQSITSLYEEHRTKIIFAEPVGSCTDLVATIAKPLAKFRPELQVVISVFADACLLLSLIKGTSCFLDENVQYIYKKQLEEADILVINKIDLLNEEELNKVKEVIRSDYSTKKTLFLNSFDKELVHEWITACNDFRPSQNRKSLELDYDLYGEGEARLAWLDEELSIFTADKTAATLALQLVDTIYKSINEYKYFIGHLKFFIDDGENKKKISYTASGREKPSFSFELMRTHRVSLLINARVQTGPHRLQEIVDTAIKKMSLHPDVKITVNNFSSFRPGKPKPTHRFHD
jgi:G3E family GTPase